MPRRWVSSSCVCVCFAPFVADDPPTPPPGGCRDCGACNVNQMLDGAGERTARERWAAAAAWRRRAGPGRPMAG